LRAVGLPRIVDLGEAHTIARIAYGCLRLAVSDADDEAEKRGGRRRHVVILELHGGEDYGAGAALCRR
jgi:hypothetical protein